MSACGTATYSFIEDEPGVIQIYNRGWYWWLFFAYWNLPGRAGEFSPEGKLHVNFNPFGDGNVQLPPNYFILDTDYDSYTVVYACFPVAGGTAISEDAWILSRERTLEQSKVDQLIAKAKKVVDYDWDTNNVKTL